MSEPTFFYAPGDGILSSRSGWDQGATQVLFRAGRTSQSHCDRAQGSLLVSRDNTWLVGTAKLQSHSGIDQSAIDWTTLTVDNKEQTWTQDGVKILKQEDTPVYTYALADVAAAYAGQLSAFIRELFFLKPATPGGSAYLLVVDGFIPVSPTSVVTWHLNVPAQPLVAGGIFRAGQLDGSVIEPVAPNLTAQMVKLDPAQPIPTYRLDLAGDSAGHFMVALEAAAPGQGPGTLGQRLVTAAVQGIRCGGAFVAWLTGGAGPWSYPSPVAGPHYLIGNPNTLYQTPTGPLTSTAGGILTFTGPAVGQTVTLTKGGTPPPPPPPPPTGRAFKIVFPVTGPPTINEVPL